MSQEEQIKAGSCVRVAKAGYQLSGAVGTVVKINPEYHLRNGRCFSFIPDGESGFFQTIPSQAVVSFNASLIIGGLSIPLDDPRSDVFPLSHLELVGDQP